MHTLPTASLRPRLLPALLASSALALAGCSGMVNSVSSGSFGATSQVTYGGKIHGGNQPVSGATVNLYLASQTSNGAATLAATTTSAADGFGSFAFVRDTTYTAGTSNQGTSNHFACPTGGNADYYVYVVAKGGSTTGSSTAAANPAAEFIAPLGSCTGTTGATVNMSEVVTVATVAAIHQFMNLNTTGYNSSTPIERTIGSDGTFVYGAALNNSFDSVSNIVDLSTGLARSSRTTTGGGNGAAGVSLTITPEAAKINQLANIISNCINFAPVSGSTNPVCTQIYNAAAPPINTGVTSSPGATMNAATDLLTSLYYIFTNPTNSATSNRNDSTNRNTLNGLAGTGPYTPTLSATPTDWSIAVHYDSTSGCTNGGSFISHPTSLSLDQFGDVYIANNVNPGSLSQLSHLAIPISCTTVTGSTTTSTTIDYDPTVNAATPNHIYSGSNSSTTLYRLTPNTNTAATTITTPEAIASLAADGAGNVFYTTPAGNLYIIANAATGSTTSVQISTGLGTSPTRLIVGQSGRLYATTGGSSLTITSPNSGSTNVAPSYTTASFTTAATSISDLTVGRQITAGTTPIFLVDSTSNIALAYTFDGTNFTRNTNYSSNNTAGYSQPLSIALDGAGSIWSANFSAPSVSATDANGIALTPAGGFVKTSDFLGANASSISIDASGNIFIASGNSTITKIFGGAVPVYKPLSSALGTNRFQSIP